jgi:hypothetical protein
MWRPGKVEAQGPEHSGVAVLPQQVDTGTSPTTSSVDGETTFRTSPPAGFTHSPPM